MLRKVSWAPSQILLKITPYVPLWEHWKIPMAFQTTRALVDHHVHFLERFETHNLIFVQVFGLKIGTLDIATLLFLNLLLELS